MCIRDSRSLISLMRCIRGSSAAAPLKLTTWLELDAVVLYPRLISRGPIEALGWRKRYLGGLQYPRLISRGPIEAFAAGGGRVWTVSIRGSSAADTDGPDSPPTGRKCFNGAAADEPRIQHREKEAPRGPGGFNGAAADEPRIQYHGVQLLPAVELQWGRG